MANDQPHDSLIKWTFSNPVHAEGELRLLLPAAVCERVDWSTLTLAPGSFVDDELKQRHTDIVRLDSEAAGILGEHIPRLTLLIDDLAALGKEKVIMRLSLTVLARVAQLLVAFLDPSRPAELLELCAPLLRALARRVHTPAGFKNLTAVANYILRRVPARKREEVMDVVQAHLDKTEGEPFFSIADQLEQEGIEKGIEKGLKQGLAVGAAHMARLVVSVLEKRLAVPAAVRQRVLACTDMEILERWGGRAATVSRAEDLFDT